jgi:methionine salvage enolase-phosphatase E1
VGAVAALERLCQWWTQASKEERFQCVKRSIEGEENAPPLKALQLAIYAAEIESGEVDQG